MDQKALQIKVGAALRERRTATGLSQDGFADSIRMHRAYYGAIERGGKNLTLQTLQKVCLGLGARMSEILSEAEN